MSRCQFWLKVASEILTGANVVTRVGELAASSMAALFGTWASMTQMRSLDDLLDHFNVDEPVWEAFEAQVGSPGADYRLLAALPQVALITACGNAMMASGPFTPIQATPAERLARRVLAAQSDVREEDFIDVIGVDP